jgi:peptidylprolyl isomerase
MKHLLLAAAAASLFLPVHAQEPAPIPSPGEIAAAAPAADWVAIAPSDLLVMDLAPDAKGKPRRVVIQLMPAPFSQGWIANIRKLAAAHWWDGTSVNRVQDNYVAQWGDATEKKPLPEGLATISENEYVTVGDAPGWQRFAKLLIPNGDVSRYASFEKGWPVAAEGTPDSVRRWPLHCYGMVGVGRNLSPDTGSGAELYTVIGHAPRHLDRNIALVGRVISGIEHLSSLPRGTGALGFYESKAERIPIKSIRLASELPVAKQPKFEYLLTDSDSFGRYADARANRRDPFFIRPAGGADICNIPVPIRPVAAK